MKIITRFASGTLAVLICFGSIGFPQQAGPSLEDTATWLQNAYVNHGTTGWSSGRSGGGSSKSLVFAGCVVKMTSVGKGHEDDGTSWGQTAVDEVSLQEMDPALVKTESTGHVWLETANGKKAIKTTRVAMDGTSTVVMQSTVDWGVDVDGFTERVKTAWIHAIQLCGGKSSVF